MDFEQMIADVQRFAEKHAAEIEAVTEMARRHQEELDAVTQFADRHRSMIEEAQEQLDRQQVMYKELTGHSVTEMVERMSATAKILTAETALDEYVKNSPMMRVQSQIESAMKVMEEREAEMRDLIRHVTAPPPELVSPRALDFYVPPRPAFDFPATPAADDDEDDPYPRRTAARSALKRKIGFAPFKKDE
jgi:DNA repair ATPase RecN